MIMETKVEEGMEISIKETKDEEQSIMDYSFSVNTSQSGKASFISPTINGSLECVIISSTNPVEVCIYLDEYYEDILLLDMRNFSGSKYFPLRIEPVLKENERLVNSAVKWALNNKLRIEVKGPFNSTVNFIVRYC